MALPLAALLASSTAAFPFALPVVTNVCNLDWNYCPRDPGCITYTMSVHDVRVHDSSIDTYIESEALATGDKLVVEVTGITTITSVPVAGSYRIYGLTGGNVATGVLTDVLVLNGTSFTMTIPFTIAPANFNPTHAGFFEFGIDVFQMKSGSDEAMCIEVESVEYASYERLKPSPAFVFYCTDGGDGKFTPSVPAPPIGAAMVTHHISSPSCNETKACDLDWFYCPRDPGCTTYTMSTDTVVVDVRDKTTIKAGDKVTLTVNGTTTLKSCPAAGSYRIYSLVGKNQQAGILSDILTILPGGVFILSIPITLIAGDFVDDWFEFGLDVFQEKSGSDEAMCIQISNPAYAKAMAAKTSPAFVTDCTDLGGGHFAPCHPTCKEIVYPAVCLLD